MAGSRSAASPPRSRPRSRRGRARSRHPDRHPVRFGHEWWFAQASAGAATITLSTPNDASDPNGASAFLINALVTIEGPTGNSSVTIARAGSAPAFRLFDVTDTGSLTLENLTLSGGLCRGATA